MPEITHYWDVMELSNPPGVVWKMSDGSTVYGSADFGKLPETVEPSPYPRSINGVDPSGTSKRMIFGEWRPISEWLAMSNNPG